MSTTTDINTLKINYLTQAQYDAAASGGTLNENEIYMTPSSMNNLIPIGVIQAYGGSTAPNGWLICDGSAVSRTTYSKLFAVIGTTYGTGDGSTTFNIPDFRGRALFGAGSLAANTTNYWGSDLTNLEGSACTFPLGERAGETKHTLTVAQMPSHTHSITNMTEGLVPSGTYNGTWLRAETNYTDATGGDGAHNNLPPYTTTNFIIKY